MSGNLDYEINKELGECYLFMGDIDKAEEYYLKAASSNGVHPDPYLGLATIAVQRGDLVRAMELYSKANEIHSSDKSVAGIALIEMEDGDHEQAFDHFIQALNFNPANMIAIFGLVQTGQALGRLNDVIPHLEKLLGIAPDKHDVRYSLAGCLASLGRNAEAAAQLEYILHNEPENDCAKELYAQLAA